MALDHGTLNLPLAKRGDIDKQIDAYKAGLAHTAKTASKSAASLRAHAKSIVDGMDAATVARLSERAGLTVVQGKKKLASMARFEPSKILALASKVPA